ncbi:MAG: hypothetical protein R2932_42750 [Caldilineaceae bacterium]
MEGLRWWESDTPLCGCGCDCGGKTSCATWRYAHKLLAAWRDLMTALPEHGVNAPLSATAANWNWRARRRAPRIADHATWAAPGHCEGARLILPAHRGAFCGGRVVAWVGGECLKGSWIGSWTVEQSNSRAVGSHRPNVHRPTVLIITFATQPKGAAHGHKLGIICRATPMVMAAYRKVAWMAWFQRRWVALSATTPMASSCTYKPHWYNGEFDGIHFEFMLDAKCVENKVASIQLHITHKALLPDRDRFNALTIPRMKQVVADWDARYEFSETKLSERLNLTVTVTKSSFAKRVSDELAQVCRLGVIIDEALGELWLQESVISNEST